MQWAIRVKRVLALFLAIMPLESPTKAAPPDGSDTPIAALQSLTIEPDRIELYGSNRQQQLLITGWPAIGQPIDVTHLCTVVSSDPSVLAVSGGRVQGIRDGEASIRVSLGKCTTNVAATIRNFTVSPPVHFANDVMPLFSKLGCNSGGCHGKASGQNGFKLSVFGFDPEADYNAIVKESRSRRVFPAAPEHSLLLLKPTGKISHGGGRRLEAGSPDYLLLRDWLTQGTPVGQSNGPLLVALHVSPTERILALKARQQILATALYSDGSRRDVTAAASYTSNADHVAAVDGHGLAQIGATPGEGAITVNYMGQVAAVLLQAPRPDAPNPYPVLPTHNKIDEFAWSKLKTMGIVPSELCEDTVFLRRAYVDVLGTLPRPGEVRAFLAEPGEPGALATGDASATRAKRAQWIDKLLERPEYADYWALQWADLLLVNRDKLGDRGAFEMHRWLRSQLARNRPYDEWARDVITASGSSSRIGPVNF
ncbi:MAG TPA: DUF1549 domain-containing protein, partial [Gemmataceae bacterium]|nr:DUF1549 domain-containing protein [Gemmataceae bacterium]